MSDWQDMADAPKGSEEHVAPTIIAAGDDNITVCLTRWLPKEERWNMFSKASPPIAWQTWPTHPGAQPQQFHDRNGPTPPAKEDAK